tara:strand:+ start:47 stop:316 length:270 start_codon:yes stop_codon:yes gene_type:complete
MRKYILLIFFVILNAQFWESSFAAGNFDDNNNFMGGSEVLQLVSHKNKLFASVSYWQDESNIWYGGDDLILVGRRYYHLIALMKIGLLI